MKGYKVDSGENAGLVLLGVVAAYGAQAAATNDWLGSLQKPGTLILAFIGGFAFLFVVNLTRAPGLMAAQEAEEKTALKAQIATEGDKLAIRNQLAKFEEQANFLRTRCAQIDGDELNAEINGWYFRACDFIEAKTEASYGVRFKSDDGFNSGILINPKMTRRQLDMSMWLSHRIIRLHELMDKVQ